MRHFVIVWLIGLTLILGLAACGGSDADSTNLTKVDSSVTGDASQGEKLYKQTTIGAASAPGCVTCHSVDEGVTIIGPSHYQLGERAGTVKPGMSAEAYIRESILEPNAHISEGFSKGIMYQNYDRELSEQEVADLVAFLASLK